jgi:hypothetical protein
LCISSRLEIVQMMVKLIRIKTAVK